MSYVYVALFSGIGAVIIAAAVYHFRSQIAAKAKAEAEKAQAAVESKLK